MASTTGLLRKAHFLGTKIRSLRKRGNLTLDDLSARCIQVNAAVAPSVSYLSMIETGKRVPSAQLLEIFARVFQKDVDWFLDESADPPAVPQAHTTTAIEGIQLEPGFLFSRELLQTAIPELLAQSGTTGRQFAHLLIRAYQEANQNRFPDLERAAESVGDKIFPLSVDELLKLAKRCGLKIRWFDRSPFAARDNADQKFRTLLRSFYDEPNTVFINSQLKTQPERLRYDLASHIGHKVLHNGDGICSSLAAGTSAFYSSEQESAATTINSQDILFAWRDFECSFFSGALLCPKLPFRQYLARHSYSIDCGEKLGLTPSVVMRRMTSVSPYEHWHYFDAYPPGNLRAVYRGNGIPLPWGNMRMVADPCRHWAVFRMLNQKSKRPHAQISVLKSGEQSRLYCCESVRTTDAAGNPHVICAGIDLVPALDRQGFDTDDIVLTVENACRENGGSAMIPESARAAISSVGKFLNIGWIEEGINDEANMICPRSSACPRPQRCTVNVDKFSKHWLDEEKERIIEDFS